MNFYDFHIGDYASRTAHLEPLEDIAYRRMLDLYYTRECALPPDVAEIARLIRMRNNLDEITTVLREFFTDMDGEGWSHAKCEEVIAKAREKSGKASKSAHSRWDKAKGDADGMRTHSERMEDAERSQCEGNAPTTHYPLPNTQANACDAAQDASAAHAAPPKAKRGTRLPADWVLPRPWGLWALNKYTHWTEEIVRDEALKFSNHWHAATGKNASKLDWYGTWQNWCMSDICQRAHPPPSKTFMAPRMSAAEARMAQACPGLVAPHLRQVIPQQTDFIVEAPHAITHSLD